MFQYLTVHHRIIFLVHLRVSQQDSDKQLKPMNMQHKAGDSDTVPLQYVVGVVACETWNSFRHTVCSPSWVEEQMAWVVFCSKA